MVRCIIYLGASTQAANQAGDNRILGQVYEAITNQPRLISRQGDDDRTASRFLALGIVRTLGLGRGGFVVGNRLGDRGVGVGIRRGLLTIFNQPTAEIGPVGKGGVGEARNAMPSGLDEEAVAPHPHLVTRRGLGELHEGEGLAGGLVHTTDDGKGDAIPISHPTAGGQKKTLAGFVGAEEGGVGSSAVDLRHIGSPDVRSGDVPSLHEENHTVRTKQDRHS